MMTSQSSTCTAPLCGYSVPASLEYCPECGRRMLSSRALRKRGLLMLLAGTFLLSLMGAVTYILTPMLTTGGFSGTPEQARTIVQFCWLLIAFGLVGAAAGAWQLATARRNRFATTGMLALAGLVVIAARVTDLTLNLPRPA
jgi:predicted nucleic acid-binding Zn ribbon protein